MVECILDSGCQIVAMNSVIWEKLGNNLQVERVLKMEATNSTMTKMHGRLHNIRFTFDDIDIYLQVQVMPNAPYDILLGHPFYALTECITKDFAVRGTPLDSSSFLFLTLFYFYSLFSVLLCYIFTGSISTDCDRYGHSHVM
jgi:hypothetical protein